MKILINKSFVSVEGKDLVAYYMNQEYDLNDAIAKKYIEKGLAIGIETKKVKKEVKKEEVVKETKTTKSRKKKTEEK